MKKLAPLTLVLIGLLPFVPSGADEKASPFVREPHVSFDEKGAPTITFLVDASLGHRKINVARAWKVDGTLRGRSTQETPVGGRVRVSLTGPDDQAPPPATLVHYDIGAVGNGDAIESLGSFELRTLPAPDARAVRFCAIGDSGFAFPGDKVACGPQVAVAKALLESDPDLVLHTGDVVYLKGEPEGQDPLFFRPYKKTLSRVPFFPCLGNHDTWTDKGQPALTNYPYPPNPNGNQFYSFDVANVHFIALDSNEVNRKMSTANEFLATAQGKWLKADLAATRATWKIVYFHHPLYSATKARIGEYAKMRSTLEDLFLDAGVDLVINGHDHYYWRSKRIAHGKPDANGIVHLVTGGGGAPLYELEALDPEITAKSAKAFHFMRFAVKGSALEFEAVAASEGKPVEVIDSGTISTRAMR